MEYVSVDAVWILLALMPVGAVGLLAIVILLLLKGDDGAK